MADSLEAQLNDDDMSGAPRADIDGFSVAELVDKLDNALNSSHFYSKSSISRRNLRGIMKANAQQTILMDRYGFRSETLDNLIMDKMQCVLSVDGLGRKQIADIISKGTVKVEARSGFDIIDRAFGGNAPR
jgi:hypothetical protein